MKKYKECEYIVYPFRGSYCGYVKLPDKHPYVKLTKKTRKVMGLMLHTGYDDMDIDCHGGLTFCEFVTNPKDFSQGFTKGAWIGWDYAHAGDKTDLFSFPGDRQWTAKEVESECKNVIKQVLKVKPKEK